MWLFKSLNRFHAFGLHLLASASVVALSAAIVFLLWYPGLLAYASGVRDIFLLLVLVDVVLGPFITLIIFNSQKKQKKELRRDLTVVVVVQLAALFYGLHTVFVTRPVYLAFNGGRFDLVHANEISAENLAKATRPEYQSLSYWGFRIVAAPLPNDPKVARGIVHSALSGGDDVQHMPQYYVPYEDQKMAVLKQLNSLDKLKLLNKDRLREVEALIKKYYLMRKGVGYLPLKAKSHDLVVIIDRTTATVLGVSDLKPWSLGGGL